MSYRPEKRLSSGAGALLFIGTVTVFSVISVLIFGTPAPLKDLLVMTGVMMVVNSIWLGLALTWERITRKRRRGRLGG